MIIDRHKKYITTVYQLLSFVCVNFVGENLKKKIVMLELKLSMED